MRETCLHNNWSFVLIFLKTYRVSMKLTPWSFLGEEAMMRHSWGHSPRMRGGSGWRLSPKLFRMRVYLIRWNTFLQGSTHLTFHGGAPTPYIYISCFQDDVMKGKYVPRYWPFVREITGHRWIPLTKASDAKLWCFLWSAPDQTVE